MYRLFRYSGLAVVAAALVSIAAADDLSNNEDSLQPVADLVITSGEHTVRVSLGISIGGESLQHRFAISQDQYVRRLFAFLDHNRDGQLDAREAARSPAPHMLLPVPVTGDDSEDINFAFNFRVIDDDNSGGVSVDEFLTYYRDFGDGPLRMRPR